MSNLDFLSIPIGRYIHDNLKFGSELTIHPIIFGVNYFLKDRNGRWLNEKTDKRVWFKWMELRINRDVDAITIPTGRIPYYDDLKRLFKELLQKNYSKDDYIKQFTLRIPENLAKIERISKIYKEEKEVPPKLFEVLEQQKGRLVEAREKYGDNLLPIN